MVSQAWTDRTRRFPETRTSRLCLALQVLLEHPRARAGEIGSYLFAPRFKTHRGTELRQGFYALAGARVLYALWRRGLAEKELSRENYRDIWRWSATEAGRDFLVVNGLRGGTR